MERWKKRGKTHQLYYTAVIKTPLASIEWIL
jgi:hypothetical protein